MTDTTNHQDPNNNHSRDLGNFLQEHDIANEFYKLDKQAACVIISAMQDPTNLATLQKSLDDLLCKANKLFQKPNS